MRANRVLTKLRQGKAVLVATPTPYASPKITEMLGLLDFDCAWIDVIYCRVNPTACTCPFGPVDTGAVRLAG
jgi:hypothetical protein